MSLRSLAQGFTGAGNSSIQPVQAVQPVVPVPFVPSAPPTAPVQAVPPPLQPSAEPAFDAVNPFIVNANGTEGGFEVLGTQYAALVEAALKYFIAKIKEEEEHRQTEKGDGVNKVLNRHLPQMVSSANFAFDT